MNQRETNKLVSLLRGKEREGEKRWTVKFYVVSSSTRTLVQIGYFRRLWRYLSHANSTIVTTIALGHDRANEYTNAAQVCRSNDPNFRLLMLLSQMCAPSLSIQGSFRCDITIAIARDLSVYKFSQPRHIGFFSSTNKDFRQLFAAISDRVDDRYAIFKV